MSLNENNIESEETSNNLFSVRNMAIGGVVVLLLAGGGVTYVYKDKLFGTREATAVASSTAVESKDTTATATTTSSTNPKPAGKLEPKKTDKGKPVTVGSLIPNADDSQTNDAGGSTPKPHGEDPPEPTGKDKVTDNQPKPLDAKPPSPMKQMTIRRYTYLLTKLDGAIGNDPNSKWKATRAEVEQRLNTAKNAENDDPMFTNNIKFNNIGAYVYDIDQRIDNGGNPPTPEELAEVDPFVEEQEQEQQDE